MEDNETHCWSGWRAAVTAHLSRFLPAFRLYIYIYIYRHGFSLLRWLLGSSSSSSNTNVPIVSRIRRIYLTAWSRWTTLLGMSIKLLTGLCLEIGNFNRDISQLTGDIRSLEQSNKQQGLFPTDTAEKMASSHLINNYGARRGYCLHYYGHGPRVATSRSCWFRSPSSLECQSQVSDAPMPSR